MKDAWARRRVPTKEKLLKYIKIDPITNCWLWQRNLDKDNYGIVKVMGKNQKAHRVSYEEFKGPIPEGLPLDHLCHTTACTAGKACPHRACINPDHLEPATHAVNILRGTGVAAKNADKTHCPQGHPYEGENLRIDANGRRGCVLCARKRGRECYRKYH